MVVAHFIVVPSQNGGGKDKDNGEDADEDDGEGDVLRKETCAAKTIGNKCHEKRGEGVSVNGVHIRHATRWKEEGELLMFVVFLRRFPGLPDPKNRIPSTF